MASTSAVLIQSNVRGWASWKGFWMVVLASLVPVVLTGAWVGTHQTDVATVSLGLDKARIVDGDTVNITAVFENTGRFNSGAFNATIRVMEPFVNFQRQVEFRNVTVTRTNYTNLAPGEQVTANLTWRANVGLFLTFVVWAEADWDDKLGEINEFNNFERRIVNVQFPPPSPFTAPPRPPGLASNATSLPPADLVVDAVGWDPGGFNETVNATMYAVVRNAGPNPVAGVPVSLRVWRAGFPPSVSNETEQAVTLGAGESTNVTLQVRLDSGQYWVSAAVNSTAASRDDNATDNWQAKALVVDAPTPPRFPEPPSRATIKSFYLDILRHLFLPLLVPFIALFYAAGVLADDREKGNLVYIMTRPVARWFIPVARFGVSYLISAVAITVGVFASFALLFGVGQGDVSYFWAPLGIGLIALFAYGGLFTLIGVMATRPYLIGVAFVLGWEVIAGNLVSWVDNLTLRHYLLETIKDWNPSVALNVIPDGGTSLDALRNVAIAAAAFIIGASWVMKRREFDA